jgi:hypothetical protein
VENLLIAPALIIAGVLLLPGALPIAQGLYDAILSTTQVWIAGG